MLCVYLGSRRLKPCSCGLGEQRPGSEAGEEEWGEEGEGEGSPLPSFPAACLDRRLLF